MKACCGAEGREGGRGWEGAGMGGVVWCGVVWFRVVGGKGTRKELEGKVR